MEMLFDFPLYLLDMLYSHVLFALNLYFSWCQRLYATGVSTLWVRRVHFVRRLEILFAYM